MTFNDDFDKVKAVKVKFDDLVVLADLSWSEKDWDGKSLGFRLFRFDRRIELVLLLRLLFGHEDLTWS